MIVGLLLPLLLYRHRDVFRVCRELYCEGNLVAREHHCFDAVLVDVFMIHYIIFVQQLVTLAA